MKFSDEKKEEIRSSLHSNIMSICHSLLPEGKVAGENWVCGDAYGNEGSSFNLCIKGERVGSFNDFQSTEGGDIYKFIELNRQLDFIGAMEWAAQETGISLYDDTPPIKFKDTKVKKKNPQRKKEVITEGPAKGAFIYTTAYGEPVIAVHRRVGKKFSQMSYDSETGAWVNNLKCAPDERPIYNLKRIHDRSDKPIIFHEGEGCVDRAVKAGLYGSHTTTIGGASNPHKSDLCVVSGREVYIVPDNDKPGVSYSENLASLLDDAGAIKVSIVTLPDVPPKGDIVEWLDGGGGKVDWRNLLSQSRLVKDTVKEEYNISVFGNGVDPGAIPQALLRMPGFVDRYAKYIEETSIYPNKPMAFAACLPMMGFLSAGKITDKFNTQTNTYVIGIAPSGSGKNRGRIVNKELADKVGLFNNLGEQFASSEGIEDAMERNKFMLFQNDEINNFLHATSNSQDYRNAGLLNMLLRFYGDSGGLYSMRNLAKESDGRKMIKPNLSLFGTAVPTLFYESMTIEMLTSGFFSRNIIIESTTERRMNKEYSHEKIPDDIYKEAQWWADFNCDVFMDTTKDQLVVEHTREALEMLVDLVEGYDERYREAIRLQSIDPKKSQLGASIWNRAFESINKIALLAAASCNYSNLVITEECVQIANDIYYQQATSNLYNAGKKIHINAMDKEVSSTVSVLEKNNGMMRRADLMREISYNTSRMRELQSTMEEQGIIEVIYVPSKTKPIMHIKLKKR
jgi:hypothetical protein